MSNYGPPPIKSPIIETDKSIFGYLNSVWVEFFNFIYTGDTGTSFIPTYSGLASTGTPTITASYYRSGQYVDFEIVITPATNTSSTANTTYFQLPFNVLTDGVATVRAGSGYDFATIVASSDRVYTPNWTNITTTVTIVGRSRAS